MKSPRLLILACGDIGARVGRLAIAQGWQVHGLRRRAELLPTGFTAHRGDCADVERLRQLAAEPFDLILWTPVPSGRDLAAYEVGYHAVARAIAESGLLSQCTSAVMVSSTRVYAEQHGGWVDETSPLTETDPCGVVIANAEQSFLGSAQAAVLRASGLYGDSAGMLVERVARGLASPDPTRLSNRIHRDDLAAAVMHLFESALADRPLTGVFNASDDKPSAIGDVDQWLAQQLNVTLGAAAGADSIRARSNRRVGNARLRGTGFNFRYPDYRAGYAEVIK